MVGELLEASGGGCRKSRDQRYCQQEIAEDEDEAKE